MRVSIKDITNEELTKITDKIIKPDKAVINIKEVSGGYPPEIAEAIYNNLNMQSKEDSKIIIINDYTLHMFKCLIDNGVKKENIYLLFGKWTKKNIFSEDKKLYNIMKTLFKYLITDLEDNIDNVITLKELFSMEITFDHMIINPPYECGTEITRAVIDNCSFKQYINLMPLGKYRYSGLYKHVAEFELADRDAFEDASVQKNLCICILNKTELNKYNTFEDLEFESFNDEYKDFYTLNYEVEPTVTEKGGHCEDFLQTIINSNNAIYIGVWKGENGFVKGDNADSKYNLNGNKEDAQATLDRNKLLKKGNGSVISFLICQNEISRKHLTTYLYENPLATELIKGLNKTYGSFKRAIPNINWNLERDYANITLNEIMLELKERNSNAA